MTTTAGQTRPPAGHAVVIGASMAGLLAARVLADTYQRVTVVDRDALPDAVEHRRGVQQGRHAHALLARGREALEELFPGLTAELVARGALRRDMQGGFRWCNEGHLMRKETSGTDGLLVSRPLLERRIRARVAAVDNVAVVARRHVTGPLASADNHRVTGLRYVDVTDGAAAAQHTLPADLVVDASGRGSRGIAWLAALGYPTPRVDEVHVDLAYATRTYRRAPGHLDGDGGIAIAGAVTNPRGGALLAMEDDRWIATLIGYAGDDPPIDPDGFCAFAASLPSRDLHGVIADAEPLDDPVRYRFPASVRHRYEHLTFPEGYLVFGDAICSFNPAYAQGMSVAAAEALELRDCLRSGTDRLAQRFLRRAAKVIDIPWDIVVGGDLRFPFVEGRRTLQKRFINAYVSRLHVAAAADPMVGRAFLHVANLVARPERLLTPGIALRVLRGNLPHVRSATGSAARRGTLPLEVARR